MTTIFSRVFLVLIAMTLYLDASSKIYIDSIDANPIENAFMIHQGHNEWISVTTLHKDLSGLYAYEDDIINAEYQKSWKCPYCYQYWPIGTACQNAACPSKYN